MSQSFCLSLNPILTPILQSNSSYQTSILRLQSESDILVVPTTGRLGLTNGPIEPLPCKYIDNAIYTAQPL